MKKELKKLVVLVADVQQKVVIETLLEVRYQALNIPQLVSQKDFDVYTHPYRDPGVYQEAVTFLSVFKNKYHHALVLLDSEWEGTPGSANIKNSIQNQLDEKGWKNRSATIVIEPELEIWVWSSSQEVYNILGITAEEIRAIAEQKNYWLPEATKPQRPKELMDEVLRQVRKHRSAALFKKLAEKVSLRRCEDAAFQELKQTLQKWFPHER